MLGVGFRLWALLMAMLPGFILAECGTGNSPGFELGGAARQLSSGVRFASMEDGGHALTLSMADVRKFLTPCLNSTSLPMVEWANQAGITAVVNGGYFYSNTPLSLVVVNGERLADNVAAVTRNNQSFPVLRSAVWASAEGEVKIGWVGLDDAGSLREFSQPMPYQENQAEPLKPPEDILGTTINPDWAIGGGPRLLKDGLAAISYDEEIFWGSGVVLDDVRPRTAICITREDTLVLYVNEGMRLDAMPQKLLGLGCVEAMNLDGGGSSAMYVEGRAILDHQRAVPVVFAVRAPQ